jgi:hypothetical protein
VTENVRRLGCLKDPRDDRDLRLAARVPVPRDYQPREENLDNMASVPRFVDQRQTNSCVGNASARGVETNTILAGLPDVPLSEQDVYTKARLDHLEPGAQLEDTGTWYRGAFRALAKVGVARQTDWPLNEATINQRPPISVEMSGLERARGEYWRLSTDPDVLKREICWTVDTYGEVNVGFGVGYAYMYHAGDAVLSAPSAREVLQGGHATRINSYRDGGRTLLNLGSWNGWGFSYRNDRGALIQSAGWLSHEWLAHPWWMDSWVFVLGPKLPKAVNP